MEGRFDRRRKICSPFGHGAASGTATRSRTDRIAQFPTRCRSISGAVEAGTGFPEHNAPVQGPPRSRKGDDDSTEPLGNWASPCTPRLISPRVDDDPCRT